jgi:signal transduction histidine kinase
MAETFDVTDLRQSKKITSDLRKEVRERENDFRNRLLQAQRLETIGVLAGGIAHDFNNILATISGYAEMLKDDLLNDPFNKEKTDRILSAVNRARSLTNQILTFSRQAGQERAEVNVNDILKETLIFLKTITSPGIIIDTDLAKIELPVFADPTQLFRVFLNLMTNGIQSMEQKGGTLEVASCLIDSKRVRSEIKKDIINEYILVTIKDTGIGMDNSILPRIFEPFYTTKEVGKGTGLGLSVVYGIISEMDGEIFVSSKLNEGSVFEVYLPVSGKISPVTDNDNNLTSQ